MPAPTDRGRTAPQLLSSPSGLRIEINANGSIRRIDLGDVVVNLFPGSEVEGGPANLYLRWHDAQLQIVPLLGPGSPAAFSFDDRSLRGAGEWQGIRFALALVLAESAPAWFWQVELENASPTPQTIDLVLAQDLALAPYGAVRLNEYYVSHYVDHQPLEHAQRGWMVASRQNLASGGRNPWAIFGSLRRGVAFATDALDVYGLSARCGLAPAGLVERLPGRRRQHEHSMAAIQDAALQLAPGARSTLGFFGAVEPDHPAATSRDDLARVERILALPEASWPLQQDDGSGVAPARSLFAPVAALPCLDLGASELDALFGTARRNEEREAGELLSFFAGAESHVVLRAKERRVVRPHGHILRTGTALAPDETALASTTWMSGVFHSMVTQGHVSINHFLSTVRGYLGLFRSHGQRVFAEIDGAWHLLDVPSAYEIAPDSCRWLYKHAQGLIEVRSTAHSDPHELGLSIDVRAGAPMRFLICHHVALDGDDGGNAAVRWSVDGEGVFVAPPPGSGLAQRFPAGGFRIVARDGTRFERVGGDELLFADGGSRGQPFVCIVTAAASAIGLGIRGELVTHSDDVPRTDAARTPLALPRIAPAGALAADVARLADILPWYEHDALIHFLAPRGLEQYSGGGWGTRDVCQGPVELLLALDRAAPVRELLLRVFAAQNPDGDWPQWFTFFERERSIRAGDAHGDIVFWPLLALAQYLLASEDAALLDERVPFFAADPARAEQGTVWQHVERALAVIDARRIGGTQLAAYGHGDWNDALQPADPAMRERMCSAWTVTLHTQVLKTLAAALRRIGRAAPASAFEATAARVQKDFQDLLLVDGVVTGYALFGGDGEVDYLLHPRDAHTGVRYSLLPMIHAIISDMLSPAQARAHLALIARHLTGPDGARLFDRPLDYRGGPQRFFQRAEASAFFGREIGLMYTHAHLRYAEALAHAGEAQAFFEALCKANPIGIRAWVPSASLRQANCYYSSSDAAFHDRYQASAAYDRIAKGEIPLDGGWRIYSSGPGIALSLIVRCLLGVRRERSWLTLDPVLPRALDGLRVDIEIAQRPVTVTYEVGAAGCGPIAVILNGEPLPFERGANPYRTGAAEIQMAEFAARLRANGNALTVRLD